MISGKPNGRESSPAQLVADLIPAVFEGIVETDRMETAGSVSPHFLLGVKEIGMVKA
jgi:hypothetical protein